MKVIKLIGNAFGFGLMMFYIYLTFSLYSSW